MRHTTIKNPLKKSQKVRKNFSALFYILLLTPQISCGTLNTDNTVNTGDAMIYDKKQSVYIQVVQSIKNDILTGAIEDGEKLPSCRDLALRLGINPNTVQRAYSELEAGGYIQTIPKKGAYARSSPIKRDLIYNCQQTLLTLKNNGVKKQEMIQMIDKLFEEEQND